MKLTDTVVLKFKYEGSVILVRVSLVHNLTWAWVAKEVLRLHLLSLDMPARKNVKKIRIAGIVAPNNERLDLDERLLYYDLKSMLSSVFTLLTEGPFALLTDRHILCVFSYLDIATAVNAILRTSKRLYKIFSSDTVWSKIPFTFCTWLGAGSFGVEDVYWEKIKDDAGLILLSIYRLRWMSHHSSKLKLFYGAARLDEPGPLLSLLRGESHSLAKAILIVSDICCQHNTQRFAHQLHYVVPESATKYHISRECKPYLAEAMVLDVEPSPSNSRSRNLSRDPGTLVEGSIVDMNFKYRRIGDPRLTFLGVDISVAQSVPYEQQMNYRLWYQLTAKTIGNILLVEYNERQTGIMYNQLEALWCTLQYDYGATVPGSLHAWEAAQATRYRVCTTPVVIYLYIDWTVWAPLGQDPQAYEKSPDFRIGIQHAVFQVHEMVLRLCSAHPHRRAREWYVQPVDATAPASRLNSGFFAGLNWLLRAISSK